MPTSDDLHSSGSFAACPPCFSVTKIPKFPKSIPALISPKINELSPSHHRRTSIPAATATCPLLRGCSGTTAARRRCCLCLLRSTPATAYLAPPQQLLAARSRLNHRRKPHSRLTRHRSVSARHSFSTTSTTTLNTQILTQS